ncbi:MAG: hypothetical protein ACMXYM_01010 [Candidatus Woesearchaeota archaeon]
MPYARCTQESYSHLDHVVAHKLSEFERRGSMIRFDGSSGLEGIFRFHHEGLLDDRTVVEVHRPSGVSVEFYWSPDDAQLKRDPRGPGVSVQDALQDCNSYTLHLNMPYVRDRVARLRSERS